MSSTSLATSFPRLDSLIEPKSQDLSALRKMLVELGPLAADISETELLARLQLGGLHAAPLLGRKIAISGSAQQDYKLDASGRPLLGIGDAVAEGMLLFGGDIVINSFTPTMNADRMAHLQGYGRDCHYIQSDMSTREGAFNFVEKAIQTFGRLDVLVLNAGTYFEPDFPTCTDDELDKLFNLNFRGPMHAINKFIELVGPDASKARIIVTSSINAQLSESAHRLYDASKGALESFVKATSLDLAQRGIDMRINGVAPGLIYTPLTYQALTSDPATQTRLEQAIPLGIGNATDMIMPYIFLAMASNNYMTGTILDASGGLRVTQGTEIFIR